ncbi:MAG: hypothetical protein Kow0075_01660 [Salibacteraceae bacterium]
MKEDQRLIDLFFDLTLFFIRQIRVLLLFSIVGLLSGVAVLLNRQTTFESSTSAYSTVVSNTLIQNVGQALTTACSERNYNGLANMLKVPLETASKVKSVEFEIPEGLKPIEDLNKDFERNLIEIYVEATDSSIFDEIEGGILRYFETNKTLKTRLSLKAEELDRSIAELHDQIAFLDSVQHLSYRLLANGRISEFTSFNTAANSPQVETVNLRQILESLRSLRAQLSILTVISPLNQNVAVADRNFLTLVSFIILGFITGVIFVLVRKTLQMAKRRNGNTN